MIVNYGLGPLGFGTYFLTHKNRSDTYKINYFFPDPKDLQHIEKLRKKWKKLVRIKNETH